MSYFEDKLGEMSKKKRLNLNENLFDKKIENKEHNIFLFLIFITSLGITKITFFLMNEQKTTILLYIYKLLKLFFRFCYHFI